MFLDNLHLMQGWIPKLERKLEVAAESAHPGFQCFFSAEPINGAPQAKIIPESILQMCIKVSNEPPSDMKSNMRRAFAAFTPEAEDRLSTATKRTAYKSILFGLCFYHSLLLGRKKFGTGIGTGGNGCWSTLSVWVCHRCARTHAFTGKHTCIVLVMLCRQWQRHGLLPWLLLQHW